MECMELGQRKSERGFTLVELAIVMIIIGLLIGGILKGQELIANAQVGASVSQVKAIDAATTTFKDKYDALPGDMVNAATRLPATGCGGAACTNGSGNGQLNSAPLAAPGGEAAQFFRQLSAAQLVTSVAQDGTAGWGDIYPEAKVGGGFIPGYTNGAAVGANANPQAGHYLGLVLAPGAGANNAVTPNEAQRIDTKIDDGVGTLGIAFGGNAACGTATGYNEANQSEVCDMAIRFQN
jgi:prepilin-type N-terminal cleavage/methylation domain-containing protein